MVSEEKIREVVQRLDLVTCRRLVALLRDLADAMPENIFEPHPDTVLRAIKEHEAEERRKWLH